MGTVNLLLIEGTYHYAESEIPGLHIITIVIEGDLNMIGDPDGEY